MDFDQMLVGEDSPPTVSKNVEKYWLVFVHHLTEKYYKSFTSYTNYDVTN